ncbi:MAG TPA: flagellar basal body P-ring protein FlgI, partial [candidate division Zixibacteria bacterium]|nr:flagellar basal body P-ring protein FlgI [candidate division Zixibacteria bacterium]
SAKALSEQRLAPAEAAKPGGGFSTLRHVRVRDIAAVEGVRDNLLIGYGLVVGLNGRGDSRQTYFTTQMLANVLQRMGMQVPASQLRVNNVAAVFVTAVLPPFSRPGTQLDVTVSSSGDAKSLEGGTLLLTPLRAGDGQVYAEAQGPLTLGGYTAGGQGNKKQVNHPNTARVPGGAIVERDSSVQLASLTNLSLLLREADFTTATLVAQGINREIGHTIATAADGRRVQLSPPASNENVTELLSRIQNVIVDVPTPARVVVNERTGTVVMGRDVRLGPVSILHGSLTIEVATQYNVSQPNYRAQGQTMVVPETTVQAQDAPANRIQLEEGATVEQLVSGLQNIGATARDVVSILQALKAAGALQAELEVL